MRLILFTLLTMGLSACNTSSTDGVPSQKDIEFQVLTRGDSIALKPHVRAEGLTVFDFYADWCAPCKELNKSLVDIKRVHGDKVEIYKLDIVGWESALARDYNIRDLPYLMVYDDGELIGNGPSVNVLPILVKRLMQ